MDGGADDLFSFNRTLAGLQPEPRRFYTYVSFQLVTEIIQENLTTLRGSGSNTPCGRFHSAVLFKSWP